MSMLKEFAQYIVGLSAPNVEERGGALFSDKPLYDVEKMKYRPELDVPDMDLLHATTLGSIVDFIRKDVDEKSAYPLARKIIHIQGPGRVLLTSEITATGKRWDRLLAEAEVAKFPFGQFMDREVFHIQLQTQFVQDEGTESILQLISRLADGVVTEGDDDGMSQKVVVRQGIQRLGMQDVPNPVCLTPYRTFPEAEQPTTPFVFRMRPGRGDGDLPSCALFESDGSMWRVNAMSSIYDWLVANLPGDRLESGEIVIIR